MTKRKSTGPKTAKGKNISSRNALSHGATARTFLDREELGLYQSLVYRLTKQYRSDDPLVELAIERLARLTVLWRRIANIIDAEFHFGREVVTRRLSRGLARQLLPEKQKTLMDLLLDESNRRSSIINTMRSLIAIELRAADPANDWTSENYLYTYPSVCRYLAVLAETRALSVEQLIDQIIESGELPDDDGIQHVLADAANQDIVTTSEQRVRARIILVTSPVKLGQAVIHFRQTFVAAASSRQEEIDAAVVRAYQKATAIPNPEQMDRLMRYHTTIKRQLSIAIGELLALTDKRAAA